MADARRIARQRLESLKRAGVTNVKRGRKALSGEAAAQANDAEPASRKQVAATAKPEAVKPSTAARPATAAKSTAAAAAPAPLLKTRPQREAALDIIRNKVAGCVRCEELCSTRTQTVFGVGNPLTKLCFLGEAPGADEDKQGEPFVGRAGQLLTKIIEACTLRREDIYILNVLKCRPPNNRPPNPNEVANCREYLDGQLDIIRPEFLCCLGSTAAKTLLQTEVSISKLRGKFQEYRGIRVMCTYHPAYLLRNPDAKKEVWADMKTLMREMGVELGK
ncbi:MAG: uracil-DNA glycosylase [Planctomycetia bacterium]|nr:uracil-DNA glycosylase [Planctomycetia bacterium]